MSKIISIELENFKSFGKRTTVSFAPSFNVITGSNGSGKSNIISAIKFVILPHEFDDSIKFITKGKDFTRVTVLMETSSSTRTIISKFYDGSNYRFFIDDKEVGITEYQSRVTLLQVTGPRLIDTAEFLWMNATLEKEIARASKTNQYIVVSLKELNSADNTIVVNMGECGYSQIKDSLINNYYIENFGYWVFLTNINIKTALELIYKKSDDEIKNIINLTKDEISELLERYQILPTDKLSCELRGGEGLTNFDIEFCILAKTHSNLKELSTVWHSSHHALQTNIKILLAKVLLSLYPNLKEELQLINK